MSPKKATTQKKTSKKTKKGGNSLAAAQALLSKAFKPGDIGEVDIDITNLKKSHPHLNTGSIIVDYTIGGKPNQRGVAPCPGLPRGRLVNVYGHESSGKTTLTLEAAALVIENGGEVGFVDWEHALDLSYASNLGIPMDRTKFMLSQPPDLETGIGVVLALAKAGVDLIVIDSIGAGVPKAWMEHDLDDLGGGRVGLVASLWSKLLPRLKKEIALSGSCVIGISQLRKKINTGRAQGGPTTTHQGGEAWKFYSELRLSLRRVAPVKAKEYSAVKHKVEEVEVGAKIKVRIDKCKVAPTMKHEGEFYIRFGTGIDDLSSIIEIAQSHGVIAKSGNWFSWHRGGAHKELKANGLDQFRTLVMESKGAEEQLKQVALQRMSSASGADIVEPDEFGGDVLDMGFLTGDKEPAEIEEDQE